MQQDGVKIILKDRKLCEWIGDDLEDVLDAVGEHRSSNGNPKTIVGKSYFRCR